MKKQLAAKPAKKNRYGWVADLLLWAAAIAIMIAYGSIQYLDGLHVGEMRGYRNAYVAAFALSVDEKIDEQRRPAYRNFGLALLRVESEERTKFLGLF